MRRTRVESVKVGRVCLACFKHAKKALPGAPRLAPFKCRARTSKAQRSTNWWTAKT